MPQKRPEQPLEAKYEFVALPLVFFLLPSLWVFYERKTVIPLVRQEV